MQWVAQNGIGGEAVIWLIIAFFWVVAQLVTRAKEKATRRRLSEQMPSDTRPAPQPGEVERNFETEMRRFFESIGAETIEEETPPPPRERARQRLRREPPPPPIHLVDRKPAPVVADPSLGAMDTRIDESALDTDRAYALPDEGRDENINAFVNPRTLLVNLNYLRMNMPLIPISGLSTTRETRPRPVLHGRKALRDAVTMQFILSTPLAMGEDKASYTKRVV